MFDILRMRLKEGNQFVPDIKKAIINPMHKGMPSVFTEKVDPEFTADSVCPVNAISVNPLRLDMGKCVFCGDCERACKRGEIKFTNSHKIAADTREGLTISLLTNVKRFENEAVKVRKDIKSIFGSSLKLRQVSAGGCNGCELELNACGNVNFDMGRFGIDFVASPRHADGIVITGPITENMAYALEETYNAVPDPKIIILAGSCAISGGVFEGSNAINRGFLDKHKVDLYVPGCAIHPLTFINGVLKLIGR